jgi:hypothetical protein
MECMFINWLNLSKKMKRKFGFILVLEWKWIEMKEKVVSRFPVEEAD